MNAYEGDPTHDHRATGEPAPKPAKEGWQDAVVAIFAMICVVVMVLGITWMVTR